MLLMLPSFLKFPARPGCSCYYVFDTMLQHLLLLFVVVAVADDTAATAAAAVIAALAEAVSLGR